MPSDVDSGDRRPARTEVRTDWGRLATAFSDDTSGVCWYLHLPTGDVVRAVEGEEAAKLGDTAGFLTVERVRSKEQYRWMERYIMRLADRTLAAELSHAIAGKRAFQRFKAVLAERPGRSGEWYSFRSEQLARHMRAWLDAHGLFVPRQPHAIPQADADDAPASERPTARALLDAMIDDLDAEALEALLDLAEFLSANARARAASSM
jgi:hypothetical protein